MTLDTKFRFSVKKILPLITITKGIGFFGQNLASKCGRFQVIGLAHEWEKITDQAMFRFTRTPRFFASHYGLIVDGKQVAVVKSRVTACNWIAIKVGLLRVRQIRL